MLRLARRYARLVRTGSLAAQVVWEFFRQMFVDLVLKSCGTSHVSVSLCLDPWVLTLHLHEMLLRTLRC